MGAQYLKGKHISQASCSALDSGTWKWICSLKDLALANMKKKLGRGDTIFLFYDNWLSGNEGALVTRFPDIRIPIRMQNWKLSAIIERSNWILKDPLLLPMWDNVTPRSGGYGDVTATYIRRSEIPSRIYAKHQYREESEYRNTWCITHSNINVQVHSYYKE